MSKQESIIEAFSQGLIDGLEGSPQIIKTQVSRVFIFDDKVYKLYRRDSTDFNKLYLDLSDEPTRREFIKNDFFTNHYFSPHIYLRLLGVVMADNGRVSLVEDLESVDDWVIEMNKINSEANLTNQLQQNSLTVDEMKYLGFEMTKSIDLFPERPTTDKNYYEIMQNFLNDLRNFSYLSDPYITREETDNILSFLEVKLDQKKEEYQTKTESDLINSIDNHTDNIFYENNKVTLTDSYLVSADWRIVEPLYCIYRPATDVVVLTNETMKENILQGYLNYYGQEKIDQDSDDFYLVYFALIRCGGFFLSFKEGGGQEYLDKAKRYKDFILSKI